MSEKKKRRKYLEMLTDGAVNKLTFTVDWPTGEIRLHEADRRSQKLVTEYSRDSGKNKIISSTPAFEHLTLNRFHLLKSNYDYLLAVDTNTSMIDGVKVGVCFTYCVDRRLKDCTKNWRFVPGVAFIMFDIAEGVNPETIGWYLVITHFMSSELLRNSRIGMIVDSELGNHSEINAGEKPYFRKHTLPGNIKIIYASDISTDSIENDMIRYCDRAAKKVLKMAKQEGKYNHLSDLKSDIAECKGYAFCWMPEWSRHS